MCIYLCPGGQNEDGTARNRKSKSNDIYIGHRPIQSLSVWKNRVQDARPTSMRTEGEHHHDHHRHHYHEHPMNRVPYHAHVAGPLRPTQGDGWPPEHSDSCPHKPHAHQVPRPKSAKRVGIQRVRRQASKISERHRRHATRSNNISLCSG